MKVAVFQMDLTLGAFQWNIDKAAMWIEGLSHDTDLAVLPELFDTGGGLRIPRNMFGFGLSKMQEVSKKTGIAICFSTLHLENESVYNRFYLVEPDTLQWYDKRHLFPSSKENRFITKGEKIAIFNYKGTRILPLVCYDLTFPVWSNHECDIAICVASWPQNRIETWDILLKARAIENGYYVIGAGRVGDDNRWHYPGHSQIVSPAGEIIKKADDDLECSISADIDPHFRPKVERDKFFII